MRWMGHVVGVAMVALGCAVVPSCVATSPGQSQVAQGHLYQSGEPLYDEFFQQLHQEQVAVKRAASEQEAVRRDLGRELGMSESARASGAAGAAAQAEVTQAEGGTVAPSSGPLAEPASGEVASVEALAAVVEQRVAEVKWRAKLRLDVDGELGDEGAAVTLKWVGKPRAADQKLGGLLERALNEELQILARMRGHRQELERLGSMAQGLEKNVDSVFRRAGLAKRAEVKKNIRDAQALIPLMDGRVQEVSSDADQMVRKLRSAATTAERQPESGPPKTPEVAPAPAAPQRPRPAARPAAPPRAAPARPTPPASDFEPGGDDGAAETDACRGERASLAPSSWVVTLPSYFTLFAKSRK